MKTKPQCITIVYRRIRVEVDGGTKFVIEGQVVGRYTARVFAFSYTSFEQALWSLRRDLRMSDTDRTLWDQTISVEVKL